MVSARLTYEGGRFSYRYTDNPAVMERKVELLAEMMRMSHKTVIYSGAGISVAAGIGQAARGKGATKGRNYAAAEPTATHRASAVLARAGLLHGWVQQNHDGLPQKAGVAQELVNEVHGSWFDPSNPVVKYSGSLQPDCFQAMVDAAGTLHLGWRAPLAYTWHGMARLKYGLTRVRSTTQKTLTSCWCSELRSPG